MKHPSFIPNPPAAPNTSEEHTPETISKPDKKHSELNERLSAIYKNETGELPDMQHIDIRRSHFWLKFLVCALFLSVLGSGGAWVYFFVLSAPSDSFSTHSVNLAITGPSLTDFGSPSIYTISYTNRSGQPLTKSSLTIRFPVGFVLTKSSLPAKNAAKNEWDLGVIEPGERGTLTVTGLLYGANRDNRSWRAFLTYQGATLNTEVQETASFESTIINNPYNLRINGPATIAPGMEALYTYTVDTNEQAFSTDVELAPSWPENFAITSSSPALSKTLRFNIPKGSVSTSLTFVLRGRFSAGTEKSLPIKGTLSTVLPATNQAFVVNSASVITEQTEGAANGLALAINGSGSETLTASPADMLNITLSVKNSTASLIKDGTLRLIFQAPSIKRQSSINWAKLNDPTNGDLHGEQISATIRQATLSWGKKQLQTLSNFAPGEETSVSFSVPLKDANSFDLSSIKDRTITVTGGLSYTDASGTPQLIPLSRHLITITSDLSFENRTVPSTDETKKESHAITWLLSHSFGSLKNVKVSAEVFPDVVFTQTAPPAAGIATYDPATKRLSWVIPDMPESVDVLVWPFTLTVSNKNPSQNTLISKITVVAEDQNGQSITREATSTPLSSP